MTRPASILRQVIQASAQRLAQHPNIPAENRAAFAQNAETVMHGVWAGMFGGEQVRVYAPSTNPTQRAEQRARIISAAGGPVTAAQVAVREGVSARWVRKLWAERAAP